MSAAKRHKLKPEEVDAIDEISGIVEDLYLVANLLGRAGRSKLAQEAAELGSKISVFSLKLKGELK